jgi:hypothetical protein
MVIRGGKSALVEAAGPSLFWGLGVVLVGAGTELVTAATVLAETMATLGALTVQSSSDLIAKRFEVFVGMGLGDTPVGDCLINPGGLLDLNLVDNHVDINARNFCQIG